MIETLTSLLLGLAGGVALSALRDYRRDLPGLADLLPWAFLVDDQVVLNKDGSLLAVFRVVGPDLHTSSEEELDAYARGLTRALLPFTGSWLFHADAVRRPADLPSTAGEFPGPLLRLLDAEHTRSYSSSGRHHETHCFLSATYLPPPEVYQRLASYLVQGGEERSRPWEDALAHFQEQVARLADRLSSVARVLPLDRAGLLAYLHTAVTGFHHPVVLPRTDAYLAHTLASTSLVGGWSPLVDGRHLRVLSIAGFPEFTTPGAVDFLSEIGFPFRYTVRFLALDPPVAATLLRRRQARWWQGRKSIGDLVRESVSSGETASRAGVFDDPHARRMAEEVADAIALNSSGTARFCLTTTTVCLIQEDRESVQAQAALLLKAFRDHGFPAYAESTNALAAWRGSLPGVGDSNLRRPLLNSASVADLLPFPQPWPGLPSVPCQFYPTGSPPLLYAQTTGTTPFRLTLHVGDVGHSVVVGPTGAGKSTLLATLAASHLRYRGSRVVFFDHGYSARVLALGAGADYYDLSPDGESPLQLQPLASLDTPSDLAWARSWLALLAGLQGIEVTSERANRIDAALAVLSTKPREQRTFLDLYYQLQDRALTTALLPFTLNGPYAGLLDGKAESLTTLGRFVVFEMRALMGMPEQVFLPILLCLLRRVEQTLSGDPTLLILDEAGLALLHDRYASEVRTWLLTLRKSNAAVVLATQTLQQLATSAHRHIILESCPTRILLPNPDAQASTNDELYGALGLNDRERQILAQATPKRDYYLRSPLGRRLFQLGLGPAELAFYGTVPGLSLPETLATLDRFRTSHGPDWPAAWLASRGLAEVAQTYRHFAQEIR